MKVPLEDLFGKGRATLLGTLSEKSEVASFPSPSSKAWGKQEEALSSRVLTAHHSIESNHFEAHIISVPNKRFVKIKATHSNCRHIPYPLPTLGPWVSEPEEAEPTFGIWSAGLAALFCRAGEVCGWACCRGTEGPWLICPAGPTTAISIDPLLRMHRVTHQGSQAAVHKKQPQGGWPLPPFLPSPLPFFPSTSPFLCPPLPMATLAP